MSVCLFLQYYAQEKRVRGKIHMSVTFQGSCSIIFKFESWDASAGQPSYQINCQNIFFSQMWGFYE